MKWLYATAIIALAYLGVALSLFAFQRNLLYRPDKERISPAASGLPRVSEVVFPTRDGERLICWSLPPAPGKPTILYFHGNGGGLVNRRDRFLRFAAAGYGLFMPSYRGYSGSTGQPSERAIIEDALAIYDHLAEAGTVPIILYGESLGSGVAVQVAAQRTPAAIILEAPYTSIVDVAQELYPWLPVRPFILDQFDSIAHIGKIRAPLLVIHGKRDVTIPLRFGERLFAAAPEPKEMAVFRSAGHNDLFAFGAWEAIERFLEQVITPSS